MNTDPPLFYEDTTSPPAWLSGHIVYQDPARTVAVYEDEVWYSDPYYPDGIRVDEMPPAYAQSQFRAIALEMAHVGERVTIYEPGYPKPPTKEVQL